MKDKLKVLVPMSVLSGIWVGDRFLLPITIALAIAICLTVQPKTR